MTAVQNIMPGAALPVQAGQKTKTSEADLPPEDKAFTEEPIGDFEQFAEELAKLDAAAKEPKVTSDKTTLVPKPAPEDMTTDSGPNRVSDDPEAAKKTGDDPDSLADAPPIAEKRKAPPVLEVALLGKDIPPAPPTKPGPVDTALRQASEQTERSPIPVSGSQGLAPKPISAAAHPDVVAPEMPKNTRPAQDPLAPQRGVEAALSQNTTRTLLTAPLDTAERAPISNVLPNGPALQPLQPVQQAAALPPTLADATSSGVEAGVKAKAPEAALPLASQTATTTDPKAAVPAFAAALQPRQMPEGKPAPDARPRTGDHSISQPAAPANTAQNTVTISAVSPAQMAARPDQQQARPDTTNPILKLEGAAFADAPLAQAAEQTQARSTTPQHPATATLTHIARQLADVMPQLSTRQMTISLSPDELGKVQLSLSAAEKGMVVNVVTERAETLDLLRRNIAELGQEFQAMGYDNVAFSFAQSQTQSDANFSDENTPDSDFSQADAPAADPPEMIAQLSLSSSKSLDIRL